MPSKPSDDARCERHFTLVEQDARRWTLTVQKFHSVVFHIVISSVLSKRSRGARNFLCLLCNWRQPGGACHGQVLRASEGGNLHVMWTFPQHFNKAHQT